MEYTCPTCDKCVEVADRHDAPHRPFCSKRCRMIDLGKWFNEEYCISDPILPDHSEKPPQS